MLYTLKLWLNNFCLFLQSCYEQILILLNKLEGRQVIHLIAVQSALKGIIYIFQTDIIAEVASLMALSIALFRRLSH